MVETVLKLYVRLAEHRRDAVFHLPELPKWDDGPSSANAMIAFDRIIADVATGADGTAYFAHLLIQPGPYIHRSDSSLRRAVHGWLRNMPHFRQVLRDRARRRAPAQHTQQG